MSDELYYCYWTPFDQNGRLRKGIGGQVITVTIKRTGVLRRAWRMKIQGGNNEILPHPYNELQSAIETAALLFGSSEPVTLRIVHGDGMPDETRTLR